jgi:hypothetical protein
MDVRSILARAGNHQRFRFLQPGSAQQDLAATVNSTGDAPAREALPESSNDVCQANAWLR